MNQEAVSRYQFLRTKYNAHVLEGIPRLRQLGYNPFQFLEMVDRYRDALGATKHLLLTPGRTSYGFQRLAALGRLQDSVEFAACLPWFRELFERREVEAARARLVLHDFPLNALVAALTPPDWTLEL